MLKNNDGTIGYLFPKRIAIEHLNLRKDLLPKALTMIDSLSFVVLKHDTLRRTLEYQNYSLREIVNNDSLAIQQLTETLNNSEKTLRKQKRTLKLWKLGVVSSGILGIVLGYLLAQAGS